MTIPYESESNQAERLNNVEVKRIIENLSTNLPEIGRSLIEGSQDMSLQHNIDFALEPDERKHHSKKYHQHGIITHSREFERSMQQDIPNLLEEWGVREEADRVLSDDIDGISKKDLLSIASLLHDTGKFTARKVAPENGTLTPHFDDHEEHSGDIIRTSLQPILSEQGLTDAQIEYVARCAELHFELGKVRRIAKTKRKVGNDTSVGGRVLRDYQEMMGGYTMDFAHSLELEEAANEIIDQNPDFALEIGLQFIADGLSKSEVYAVGTTDFEIATQKKQLIQELANKRLDMALINQALQTPINLEVAKVYLGLWREKHLLNEAARRAEEDEIGGRQEKFSQYLIGHEATLAARKILGDTELNEIQDRLQSKPSKYSRKYNFEDKYVREPSEIAYTYDAMVDEPEFDYEPGYWNPRYYKPLRSASFSVDIPLLIQPGEPARKVKILRDTLSVDGYYGDTKRDVTDMTAPIEKSLPKSFQIIGFQNGMEMLNPYELRDWLVRINRATPNSPLPIRIISQPKKEAIDYIHLDEALLGLKGAGTPKEDTEEEVDPKSGDKFFDTERYEYLRDIKENWGETPPMVRFRFNPDDPQDYVALKLPRPDGTEWVIAENYEHGNAMFLLDPSKLGEDETWEQVLKNTTKQTARTHPSVTWIQHRDEWKDKVLEIITT